MLRLAVSALIICISAMVQPSMLVDSSSDRDDVERADKEFDAAYARASASFDDAVARAAEDALKVVEAEIKAVTARGDLESALALRVKKWRYQTIAMKRNISLSVAGLYSAKSTKWGSQDFVLRLDRTFGRPNMGDKHVNEGTWELKGSELILNWKDWPKKSLNAAAAFNTDDLSLTWKSNTLDK